MPVVNGQRVLANSPQYQNTLNARGGINRLSNREKSGLAPLGSTGTLDKLEVKQMLPVPARTPLQQVKTGIADGTMTTKNMSALLAGGAPQPTGFTVPMPDTLPAEALNGNFSRTDVVAKRDQLANTQAQAQQLESSLTDLTGRISNTGTPTFANTDEMINRLLLNRVPTQTEQNRASAFGQSIQNQRNYATDIATAREQQNQQLGLGDLTTRRADVRVQYAEREAKLDADIKKLEENAANRGVARPFVEDQKNKLKSDALEDLSNLAAIETALTGSITDARQIVNDVIADKKFAFEQENAAIQNEINYYSTLVGEDNQRQAQQLQFALNERKAAQDKMLADEKTRKEYMIEAASNNADQGTIQAIINAKTPEEAFRLAAPFIGKLDRMQAQANLANIYSQIDSRDLSDLITLAEKGDKNAINKLGFDPRKTTGNFEAETGLRKEFNGLKVVQDATQVGNSFNNINAAYTQALQSTQDGTSKAAADQALIISFNKMLDPGSVVREGEFARSTEGQALINKWQAKVEQITQGGVGLTDTERASIVNLTRVLYADYIKTHNDKAFEYRQNAVRQGSDPNYVASYMDTVGLTAESAQEGDIIIKNGVPYQKQGDQMIPLTDI